MDLKVFLLVFLGTVAMSAGVHQKFYSAGRSQHLYKSGYCTSPRKAYKTLVMSRKCYYAYSICSDGHILLLPNARSRLHRYTRPQNLFNLRKYPIIAGFWNKMNVACGRSSYNRVTYGETTNGGIRNQIRNLVNDAHFRPYTVIWATYNNMRPQRGSRTNTFQIILATTGRVTYAIFIYRNMGWNRYCAECPAPRVGFTNGKGRGYQYCLPQSASTHLRHSVKVFRISDHLTTSKTISVAQEESFHELADVLKTAQASENAEETYEDVKKNDDGDSKDKVATLEDKTLSMSDDDEYDPDSMLEDANIEDTEDLEDAEDIDGGERQGEKNVAT